MYLGSVGQNPYDAWISIPEMTTAVFKILSPEALILSSKVCKSWNTIAEGFGKKLIQQAQLELPTGESWQKVYRTFLDTLFFVVLDVSESMDKELLPNEVQLFKNEASPSDLCPQNFLELAKVKASEVIQHLEKPIQNQKVYAMQLGSKCEYRKIYHMDDFITYNSDFKVDREGSSLKEMLFKINSILEEEKLGDLHFKRLEINIFSDFNIHFINLNIFHEFATNYRFFRTGNLAGSQLFQAKALGSLEISMQVEGKKPEMRETMKRKLDDLFECSWGSLDLGNPEVQFFEAKEPEPLRVFKKQKLNEDRMH